MKSRTIDTVSKRYYRSQAGRFFLQHLRKKMRQFFLY